MGTARSVPVWRSRWAAAIGLLLAFSDCAHGPEEPVTARDATQAGGSNPLLPINPRLQQGRAGDPMAGPELSSNAGAGSSSEPALAPVEAAHATRSYYLVVIGPRDNFRHLATTPTDPEVIYLEEASGIGRDGRREQLVLASKAAIPRFKAAAKKLGMEVRVLSKP